MKKTIFTLASICTSTMVSMAWNTKDADSLSQMSGSEGGIDIVSILIGAVVGLGVGYFIGKNNQTKA